MKQFSLLSLALLVGVFVSFSVHAEDAALNMAPPREEFATAKVIRILIEVDDDAFGFQRKVQQVRLRLTSGPDAGTEFSTENGILNDREDMRMSEGETIVVRKLIKSDGSVEYLTAEKYRLPTVIWIGVFFLILTVLFGGWMGLTSIGGLVVSILILALYVVPGIASGGNPMTISLIGSFGIACTSLYLAHGFSKRTSVALLSTLTTLGIAATLSIVFVHLAKLFGMGTEESMYLQSGVLQNVNLRGLLLGGIIIGCLGVLDDVTTAQTAAIDEIRKANPSLTPTQLWKAGLSVGREHIASLINTLALAYAGASLPLLLLFKTNEGYPLWVTLNSEFLSEEIIRTLVGSATLLFAVPISTWFAAYFLRGGKGGSSSWGHSHTHAH
ncbi:YibE/F family protein [Candidatus Peregrinibacteria bacterium]|nr:YibE/F family protein [Candidatus Peregrinibacteria bacterium]